MKRFLSFTKFSYRKTATLIFLMLIFGYLISSFYEEEKNSQSITTTTELGHFAKLDALSISTLNKGIEEMAKHKVVIAGITRDNAKDLPIAIKHINYIASFFKDYRVILFENDSVDGTKEILKNWQQTDQKIHIISIDYKNRKRPNHKFLGIARNKYLEALNTNEYSDFDLLMVLDLDMRYGIDIRGIQDSFSKFNSWDAICSNGISRKEGNMFDAFAFRNDQFPWSPKEWHEICKQNNFNNPWTKICQEGLKYSKGTTIDNLSFRIGFQSEARLYWLFIMPQIQAIYPVTSNLIPVTSCFGGLAIYKRNFINNCSYDSIDNDCEHVVFHQCIKDKNNARMFLNPAQIIKYSNYK